MMQMQRLSSTQDIQIRCPDQNPCGRPEWSKNHVMMNTEAHAIYET